MKLRCAYCGLDLNEQHFQVSATALTSICDLCRQRGIKPGQWANAQIAALAQARSGQFLGQSELAPDLPQPQPLALNKQQRRACASLINAFDALTVVWQTPARRQDFYQRIIGWQDQPQANLTGDLPQDLRRLGCDITGLFDKNDLDYATRQRVREQFGYRCQYCGRYGDSVDHKDPVALSADNRRANLTLACRECNRLKGDMPYTLFVQWNQEVTPLLRKLAAAERTLTALRQRQERVQAKLAVEQHLYGQVKAPAAQALRQQIKLLQGLRDGENSQYQKWIKLRHDYVISHYQAWLLAEMEE
ncbi:HNH endonuclease [Lapidilactobacillus achengensis]|uniref:HNH endonuclease n=1 Tax=Lapidilactobacillus achengensis TaxID=2486000 RepID=A0ABW1UNS0_9LACO|nr:HNH endonuclease signature motif containing protein [Lapidilactobacillus achengensis]